jgi:hypothetical protein
MKKFIIDNTGKLCMDDRNGLLTLCIKAKLKICENGDGSRINLDLADVKTIKFMYEYVKYHIIVPKENIM